MDSWRKVWREGVAPQLSTRGLLAVRDALTRDDPRLIQDATTKPPPLYCVIDWPCDGACLIGYAGWQGDGLEQVGQVDEYFMGICVEADKRLGEMAGVRYLLNWFDETPREVMRREMLREVDLVLVERNGEVVAREGAADDTGTMPEVV